MKNIELLAPAGNLSRLKVALAYGADAVYAGGDSFSLRVRAKNFTDEELAEAIRYTHAAGKKFYLALNVIPHNEDIDLFIEYIKQVKELKPDAFIISDLGAFNLAKEHAPEIPIHVSTQANNVNYATVDSWHKMGAERVVLARELSFDEVHTIREKTSPELELEAFIHGAMCISYSGRCLLSGYMTGRESKSGDGAHPCRWNYTLMEEKRPGEHFPVFENDRGTFIFNSKDMCMIEYIPELINSGVTSFKIEGRVKTEFYVATVVSVYRRAIDAYLNDPKGYSFKQEWLDELCKVSNRGYTTGFWLKKPDENSQNTVDGGYIRTYDLAALFETNENGKCVFVQKNKLSVGDTVEVMSPGNEAFTFTIDKMWDEEDSPIESAPHPMQLFKLNIGKELPEFSMLRKKTVGGI
ncbi:MAG: U32 family peptidase C-terminal domain-containing protein [Clostridia bacterium]|nr:U32 family peptidase C-terminal domain-containing protein [Clostridia bacterium]